MIIRKALEIWEMSVLNSRCTLIAYYDIAFLYFWLYFVLDVPIDFDDIVMRQRPTIEVIA